MSLFQNFTLVLEHPLNAGNIGSVARLMKNTGMTQLTLVEPVSYLIEAGFRMAMGSIEVLQQAKVVSSLEEALDGHQLVIGTTRRRGQIRKPLITPRETANKVVEALPKNKVALVFGNEKDGLNNKDLFQCHLISSIPASSKQPSFNLAQAVMIYCYELFVAGSVGKGMFPSPLMVDQKTREKMFQLMDNTLTRIGFYEHGSPKNLMRSLRQIFGKANLNHREVRILRGIFSQMNRILDNGSPDDLP